MSTYKIRALTFLFLRLLTQTNISVPGVETASSNQSPPVPDNPAPPDDVPNPDDANYYAPEEEPNRVDVANTPENEEPMEYPDTPASWFNTDSPPANLEEDAIVGQHQELPDTPGSSWLDDYLANLEADAIVGQHQEDADPSAALEEEAEVGEPLQVPPTPGASYFQNFPEEALEPDNVHALPPDAEGNAVDAPSPGLPATPCAWIQDDLETDDVHVLHQETQVIPGAEFSTDPPSALEPDSVGLAKASKSSHDEGTSSVQPQTTEGITDETRLNLVKKLGTYVTKLNDNKGKKTNCYAGFDPCACGIRREILCDVINYVLFGVAITSEYQPCEHIQTKKDRYFPCKIQDPERHYWLRMRKGRYAGTIDLVNAEKNFLFAFKVSPNVEEDLKDVSYSKFIEIRANESNSVREEMLDHLLQREDAAIILPLEFQMCILFSYRVKLKVDYLGDETPRLGFDPCKENVRRHVLCKAISLLLYVDFYKSEESPPCQESLKSHQYFLCKLADGKTYKIEKGWQENSVILINDNLIDSDYCIHKSHLGPLQGELPKITQLKGISNCNRGSDATRERNTESGRNAGGSSSRRENTTGNTEGTSSRKRRKRSSGSSSTNHGQRKKRG